MEASKIPTLKGLLSEFEFKHIEAFPSILRLLLVKDLLNELMSFNVSKLATLAEIKFHRVIDNTELSLTAEDFWIHLNYQLIHLLDFLPTTNWIVQMEESSLNDAFIDLYKLLVHVNKLSTKLDFDLSSGEVSANGIPITLGSVLNGLIPASLKKSLGIKLIRTYSKKISHSLEYTLTWS